ncbi:MAG: PAS domain S-box protein [Myxococcales bacterium]|nr:PAS domain S-box protein [Myxococcales bacterium]
MFIEAIDPGIVGVLGYTAEQLCGDSRLLRSLVHPDDRGRLDAAGGDDEPSSFQIRCRRRDGELIPLDIAADPILGADGTCAGFEAALRPLEVTRDDGYEVGRSDDLREIELSLWFDLMTSATAVALFLVDSDLVFRRFTFVPREGGATLRTDVVGLHVQEAFPDFPGLHFVLQRAVSGARVREHMRIRGMTLELHCAPLTDASGVTRGVLGVALDLTREVIREDARRDQEAYFQSLIQTVNDGILVNDPNGMIEYANDRLAGFLGTTPRQMIGRRIFDYMDPESAAEARANLARRSGGAEDEFDFRWRRNDGTEFWSIVSAKPFYDASGTHRGSLVAVTDITRRKSAEDALREAHDVLEERVVERTEALSEANSKLTTEILERRRAEEQAIQANRTKSAFLASMSHELRTPLNAIIGYSELIAEEMEEASERMYIDDVGRIHGAARHLLDLINDILDLSKIEAAKMEIHMERFIVGDLVREIAATTMPLALKNDNRLLFECSDEAVEIISDRTKLKQILLNLISNACKFTRKGRVDVAIDIGAREDIDSLCVAVRDSGVGIPPEKLEAIFQAFTQADETVSTVFGGTGLGLAISKRLAQMLGGDITVESTVGEGSSFEVVIPLPQGLDAPEDRIARVDSGADW